MDDSMCFEHFHWVWKFVSRVKSFVEFSKPLLSASFSSGITSRPDIELIKSIECSFDIENLSNGNQYALIVSLLTGKKFNFVSALEQFEFVLHELSTLGYNPPKPCEPAHLIIGSVQDHVNLCHCLEFAVLDKSINVEKLMDDLRKLPRSFFVLKEYPKQLDQAIKLWLSKFSCLFEIPDVSDDVQNDIKYGTHVAAVLSRIYPQRIDKKSLLTNSVEDNWKNIKEILNELQAYVPENFPVSDNLFACFIADLYFATRVGVKKFIRLDTPNNIIIDRAKNIGHHQFRPSSILNKSSKIQYQNSNNINLAAPFLFKPSPRKLQKNAIQFTANSKNGNVNYTNELLRLYNEINNARRLLAVVDDPLPMIKYMAKMLLSSNKSDKTFSKLWLFLQPKRQSTQLYTNARQFLSILADPKNEFNASPPIVEFAIIMMNSDDSNSSKFSNPKSQKNNNNKNILNHKRKSNVRFCSSILRDSSNQNITQAEYVSISTQTSSMTHSMSFIRESKHFTCKHMNVPKCDASTQTENLMISQNKSRQTVTYPYGETLTGFSRYLSMK